MPCTPPGDATRPRGACSGLSPRNDAAARRLATVACNPGAARHDSCIVAFNALPHAMPTETLSPPPAGIESTHRRRLLAGGAMLVAALAAPSVRARALDHDHADWTALLRRHVVLLRGGQASQVRYAGFAAERPALQAYLDALSGWPRADFDRLDAARQQAFLINAYNAFTVALILTRYPDLKSIRELGSLWASPWKPRWIALLGGKVSLDDIEHAMLRARGRYDEPRVHFAVNCASVGCPMLREEAYVGAQLDAQLDEQAARFMADRTRNRWNARRGRLELSKIFDWYGEDFRAGHRGITSLEDFAAAHADRLADDLADRARLRSRQFDIGFLGYDWSLNDVPAAARNGSVDPTGRS